MAYVRATYTRTATWGTDNRTITFTPAVGDLAIIAQIVSGNTQTSPTCADSASGTYTRIQSLTRTGGDGVLSVYVRDALFAAASSVTVTLTTGSNTASCIGVLLIAEMGKVGASAVRTYAGVSNQSAATTPTVTLSMSTLTTNPVLTAVGNASSPAGVTRPSGENWVRQANVGIYGPTTGLGIATINNGLAEQTVTWGSTSATGYAVTVLELDTTFSVITPETATLTAEGLVGSFGIPIILQPTAASLAAVGYAGARLNQTGTQRYALSDLDVLNHFWDGRILDEPVITSSLTDTFWGPIQIDQVTFSLANGDKVITSTDIRGRSLALRRYDAVSGYLRTAFIGTIAGTTFSPGKMQIRGTSLYVPLLARKLPTKKINTDTYPDSPPEEKDTVIPVVFGNVPQLRCPCVKSDPDTRTYDYIVGWNGGVYEDEPLTVTQIYSSGSGGRMALPATRRIAIESQMGAAGTVASGNALTWPHVVPPLVTDRAFVVTIVVYRPNSTWQDRMPSAVAWGRRDTNQSMTCISVEPTIVLSNFTISTWVLRNPVPGTGSIVAIWAGGGQAGSAIGTSVLLSGVKQDGDVPGTFSAHATHGSAPHMYDWTDDGPTVQAATDMFANAFAIGMAGTFEAEMVDYEVRLPQTQATPLWDIVLNDTLVSAPIVGLRSLGASRPVTDSVTRFQWFLGTPINAPLYAVGWVATIVVIQPAPGYSVVSTSEYPGRTVLRIPYLLDRDADPHSPPELYVDVLGMQPERNFVQAIKTLVVNATWGWGQVVDEQSFDNAKAALANAGIPTLYCDGAMTHEDQAQAWLSDLLIARGMRLQLDEYRRWRITVDTLRSTTALTIRDGGVGPGVPGTVVERGWIELAESAKSVEFDYRESISSGGWFFKITRTGGPEVGAEKQFGSRFVRDHTTADVISCYLTNRLFLNQQVCQVILPQQGRILIPGDLVTIYDATLDLDGETWEVRRVSDRLTAIDVAAQSYDEDMYAYTAGPGEEPDDPDPGVWQDYSQVLPDPVWNFYVLSTDIESGWARVYMQWFAPATNCDHTIPRFRQTTFELETPGEWTDGDAVDGVGGKYVYLGGLMPGEWYDFTVRTVNGTKRASPSDPERFSVNDPIIFSYQVANPTLALPTPYIRQLENVSGAVFILIESPQSGNSGPVIYRSERNNPRTALSVGRAYGKWVNGQWFFNDRPPTPGVTYYYWARSVSVGYYFSGFSRSEYNSIAYTG